MKWFFLFILTATLMLPMGARAISPGETFPFTVQLLDENGQQVDLAKISTPYILVDIWASWCPSCVKALPLLSELATAQRTELSVIGVNVDTDKAEALKFLKDHHHALRMLFDPEGKLPNACSIDAMPTSILMKQNGEVVRVFRGFSEEDAKIVRAIVKKSEVTTT